MKSALSVANADVFCGITDNGGNRLDYVFAPSKDGSYAIEIGYARNGATTINPPANRPAWNISDINNVLSFYSIRDPGWFIAFQSKYGSNPGAANLIHNGHLIGSGLCQAVAAIEKPPTAAPQVAPPGVAPPALAPPQDSVPISTDGAQARVTVWMHGFPEPFLIDTGADGMTVNPSLATRLLNAGAATEAGTIPVKLANGQTEIERRIVINQISIGSHIINDVVSTVNETDDGMNLLPFPVLNRLGKFTIDTANQKLIFG